MGSADKYQFDLSFDRPLNMIGDSEPLDDGPVLMSLGEEDIAAIKTMAHAEGFAEGREAALKSIEKRQEELLGEIGKSLSGLAAMFNAGEEKRVAEAARLTLALASKFLPPLALKTGGLMLEETIRAALAEAESQPRLVVRVADSSLDALEARLVHIAAEAGFAGKIVLLADKDMSGADCRIEWADGGVERCERRLWQSIERIINDYAGGGAPDDQAAGQRETEIKGDGQ